MDRSLDLNLAADLFRIKKVKSIRKATEKNPYGPDDGPPLHDYRLQLSLHDVTCE